MQNWAKERINCCGVWKQRNEVVVVGLTDQGCACSLARVDGAYEAFYGCRASGCGSRLRNLLLWGCESGRDAQVLVL